jgi:phosphatidylglycerophosphate synthase
LASLSAAFGLGVLGWLAGIAYGLVLCVTLSRGMHAAGLAGLSPADLVTHARALLVGGVTALTAASFRDSPRVAVIVALAAVALVLDAVDGNVARRTRTASAFGARFDMEVDAFLILVLSVFVAPAYGVWVLSIGAMRYAFVVATWLLPWLRTPLPPRYWRKAVAATQGIVLAFAGAALAPWPVVVTALVVSLALLIESFGRDVVWSWNVSAALTSMTQSSRQSQEVQVVHHDVQPTRT